MELEQFERLEAKIDELLAKHELLSKKNAELLEIIAQKDEALAKNQARISELSQERELVGRRIGSLLEKFENVGR